LGLDAQWAAIQRFLAGAKGELLGEYPEVESGKRHTNGDATAGGGGGSAPSNYGWAS
jgi:hypothetical protein